MVQGKFELSSAPGALPWHPEVQKLVLERDPEVVFWPSDLLEARGTKAKKQHISKKIVFVWPCRLRRQGPKISLVIEMCGFLLVVSEASQKTVGPKSTSGSL